MPVIPLSVVTRIIDHVSSHMPSLLTCSTICREWLSKVKYHLFTDINVRAHGDPRKLAEFAAFLETCARIGPYVQSLSLDGRDKAQTLAASLSPEALFRILTRLPTLRCLTLVRLDFQPATSEIPQLPNQSNLESVRIFDLGTLDLMKSDSSKLSLCSAC